MGTPIYINPIGSVVVEKDTYCILIDEEYRPGLKHIEGFTHLQVIWWGNLFDQPEHRKRLIINKPYKKGPDKIGVFATHSPTRPNPVLITTIFVLEIHQEKGLIYTPYIDAEQDSPVLDIKPYHLSERVRECAVPTWCKQWPEWYEDSGAFNWHNEFNY